MTITVAVTGGIGAGKSTVCALLAARGAVVVDSDRLAREVVGPGTPGLSAVVAEFGDRVRAPDGTLNRPALASIVFADPSARRRLEAITHPMIRARFAEMRAAAPSGSVVVNDIPLLTNQEAAAAFHLVAGVGAPEATRMRRLLDRGMSSADAQARIAAQLGDEDRRLLCDVWLDNSADPADVRQLTDVLWSRLADFASNVEAHRPAPRSGPVIVPYDGGWPPAAARLISRLHFVVGNHRIDHIGSTAVAGLAAKDVIDLQLTVSDLPEADSLAARLSDGGFPLAPAFTWDTPHPEGRGYDRTAYPEQWRKRMHVNADPGRAINLHLRVRDAANWTFALRFRDWLRADPTGRAEYTAVKEALALEHRNDTTVAGYAVAKESFLRVAARRCADWAAATGWRPT